MKKRNIETRSRNHSCLGKVISIKHSQGISVALGIQYTMRIRHIVISVLSRSTIFSKIIS